MKGFFLSWHKLILSFLWYLFIPFLQLVESQYLRKLHDLYGSELGALDGVRLVPPGSAATLGVEAKQFPMHCDALIEEIKLVIISLAQLLNFLQNHSCFTFMLI